MSSLIVSGSFQDLLAKTTGVVEIRDPTGAVLGYFTPRSAADARLYENAKSLFDATEMKHRLQAEHGKGSSLEEVKSRLESLRCSI